MDKSALEYLHGHLVGHQPLSCDESVSDLITLPRDCEVQSLERFQAQPNQIRSSAALASSESFCAYINRFKTADTSIYIDVDKGRFTALLDHYSAFEPSWCTHTATLAPKKSIEWLAWTAVHNVDLKQIEFALLIEQLLDSILKPEPNTVLKAALEFQSNEKLVVGSAQNLEDGSTRFNFTKDNVNKTVTFPHRITLCMPVHENEEKQKFEGRVRYRVSGEGVLTFKFSFVKDPRSIERDAMLLLAEKTKARTEGLAHYEGSVSPQK